MGHNRPVADNDQTRQPYAASAQGGGKK